MVRWLSFLNTYDFEMQHRSGKLHGNADGLSRRPCTDCKHCSRHESHEQEAPMWEDEDYHFVLFSGNASDDSQMWVEQWSTTQLQQWLQNDIVLIKVIQWVETQQKPAFREIQSEGSFLHQYWSSFESLLMRDGVLYHQINDTDPPDLRLVAPPKVRTKIFLLVHDSKTGGHLGSQKLYLVQSRGSGGLAWRLQSSAGVSIVTAVKDTIFDKVLRFINPKPVPIGPSLMVLSRGLTAPLLTCSRSFVGNAVMIGTTICLISCVLIEPLLMRLLAWALISWCRVVRPLYPLI